MPGNQQANWWKDAILTWTYRQLDTPMFGRKNRYFEYELSVCVGFFSPSETSIRCVTKSVREGRLLPAPYEFRPPWPPRAALIPIYWNRAWPLRLPLPIIPSVNASAHPFGGFGFTPHHKPD